VPRSAQNQAKIIRTKVPLSAEVKYLGIHLERRSIWKAHIKDMENKAM
jgi:hypothetical protein